MKSKRKIKDINHFAKLCEQGLTNKELAKRYKCSESTVQNTRRVFGTAYQPSVSAFGESDMPFMFDMRTKGATLTEIANHYGTDITAIGFALRKYMNKRLPNEVKNLEKVSLQDIHVSDIEFEAKYLITKYQMPRWIMIPVDEYIELKQNLEGV